MNGYPALTTKNCPTGYVIFGDWSEFIIGLWGAIGLAVDPYGSNFSKGSVSVRALADVDFAVRHPESFAEIHPA